MKYKSQQESEVSTSAQVCIFYTFYPETESSRMVSVADLVAQQLDEVTGPEPEVWILDRGLRDLTKSGWIGPMRYARVDNWGFSERAEFIVSNTAARYIKWQPADDLLLYSFVEDAIKAVESDESVVGAIGRQFRFMRRPDRPYLDSRFVGTFSGETIHNRLESSAQASDLAHAFFRRSVWEHLAAYRPLTTDVKSTSLWELALLLRLLPPILGCVTFVPKPMAIRKDWFDTPRWVDEEQIIRFALEGTQSAIRLTDFLHNATGAGDNIKYDELLEVTSDRVIELIGFLESSQKHGSLQRAISALRISTILRNAKGFLRGGLKAMANRRSEDTQLALTELDRTSEFQVVKKNYANIAQ